MATALVNMRPWLRVGGSVISGTGMAHLVAECDVRGWFVTACGVEVGNHQGWGKRTRRLEDYPHCQNCSIHGKVPRGWPEGWLK